MKTIEAVGSTHHTVARLGLVTEPGSIATGPVFYGTSDPIPNVSELILTAIVAILCRLPAKFSVYQGGRTEYANASERFSRAVLVGRDCPIPVIDESLSIVSRWLGIPVETSPFETVMSTGGVWDMPLVEVAGAITTLRPKPSRLCYVPQGNEVKSIYTDGRKWLKQDPTKTVAGLHSLGGWLSGTSIHYSLRRFSELHPEHVHVVPFGVFGEVYQMYDRVRSKFVLAPALNIRPAQAEPDWLPLELRTLATILQIWSDTERDTLRDFLMSEIARGLDGSIHKITIEFSPSLKYRATVT